MPSAATGAPHTPGAISIPWCSSPAGNSDHAIVMDTTGMPPSESDVQSVRIGTCSNKPYTHSPCNSHLNNIDICSYLLGISKHETHMNSLILLG